MNNDGKVRYLPVGDSRMRYVTYGKGKKDMVIIPGLSVEFVTDSAEAIGGLVAPFTDEYTVWLFDVKDDVPEGYTAEAMAEDTAYAMRALGIRDARLYCASMGGMQGMYISGKYPELAGKIVIASSSCMSTGISTPVFERWISLAGCGEYYMLQKDMLDHIYSPATLKAAGEAIYDGYRSITDKKAERFVNVAKVLLDFNVAAQAERIECPVLAVGAHGDTVFTFDATSKIAEITRGEVVEYGEEYGHGVYDEAPDFFTRVREFFDR